jgi:hypothetical protein
VAALTGSTGYVPKLALTGVAIAAYFLLSAWCTFRACPAKQC